MNVEQPESGGRLLYSASEMAAMCGVSRKTWYAWVRRGAAPSPIYVNGLSKWLAKDVQRWERQLKRDSSAVTRAARRQKWD